MVDPTSYPAVTDHHLPSLLMAVANKDIETVKSLLEQGVDPNQSGADDVTPLLIAAQEGYLEITKLLLNYKANPNGQEIRKVTPLHI